MKRITMNYQEYLKDLDDCRKQGYDSAIDEIKTNIKKYDELWKWGPVKSTGVTAILQLIYARAEMDIKKKEYEKCKIELNTEVFNEKVS